LRASSRIAAYVQRSVGERDRSLLTEEVRAGIEDADRLTARDLLAAEDTCHRLNLELVQVFESCDLLLTPTLHRDPPRFGETISWIRATGVFNLPAMIICLALTALCLIVSFLGQQLAGQPPSGALAPHWPALMAWLPILLFGPVAVFLLDRVET